MVDASGWGKFVVPIVLIYLAFVYKKHLIVYFNGFMNTFNRMFSRRKEMRKELRKEVVEGSKIPKGKYPCWRCNQTFHSEQDIKVHNCKYVLTNEDKNLNNNGGKK